MEDKAIQKLVNMYSDIETELLIMIAKHFMFNDEFINSDYWRLEKLQEMGLLNEDIAEFLAKYTDKTKEEIKKALEKIGKGAFNFNQLSSAYKNGKLNVDPNILINDYTIQEIINNAYIETSNNFIKLSKKIENAAREAYLEVVESGYLKTSMGTHSYDEAIREAIDKLSNKGLTVLTYKTVDENGNVVGIRNYDVESAARREILTNTRKLSNDINKKTCEELQVKYVKLSEHEACRPKHFSWQGTIIKYKDLVNVTHYGEVDGLGGINCKHYFEAYFGNARGDELKEFSEEDANKAYELSQHQRYLERGIRKWRRKEEMFKANGDVEAYKKSKSKVEEWRGRIREFTNENKLNRDFTREYASNSQKYNGNVGISDNYTAKDIYDTKVYKLGIIDKEKSHNAIQYFESQIYSRKVENAIIIQEDGSVIRCVGNSSGVGIYGNLKNAIVTHNHPDIAGINGGSFGKDDFILLKNNIDIKELRAVDSKFIYSVKVMRKLSMQDYYGAYHQAILNVNLDDNVDYKHSVMVELASKGLIKYERRSREKVK